jgi:hypothetical protein
VRPSAGESDNQEVVEVVMKRVLMASLGACAAAIVGTGLGTGIAPAASPQVDLAIKAVQAVGNDPARLKVFCEFHKLLQTVGDNEDEAAQKQIEALVTRIGPDFSAAWDVAEELDENSEDGEEFYDAVETLAEKCQ